MPSRKDSMWAKAHKAETQYAVQLRKVARYIGDIVGAFKVSSVAQDPRLLVDALNKYANTLGPWAEAVASRMLWDVSRRNEKAWVDLSRTMGHGIRDVIKNTPTGTIMQTLMYDQVNLIKSMPLEAAERVQKLAVESIEFGSRGDSIIKEIMRSGEVSRSRAICIARTETSRATSVLTEARALNVGSTGYVWRTSLDANVRESHQKMEGRVCEWANPPEVEPGKRYHPGCIYNCRCVAEPIIPDKYL